MKRLLPILLIALSAAVYAGNADPAGSVVYSLPQTNLVFDVEAVAESFHAGPYAAYAKKFLGIDARTEDTLEYHLSKVVMTPLTEADNSARFSLNITSAAAQTAFLNFSSTGLVSMPGACSAGSLSWRFPTPSKGSFSGSEAVSPLGVESRTIYRQVCDTLPPVAVQQEFVVEKSLEDKARETADLIFMLRKTRVQIITGDTDMSYDGEAMGAAIAEMTRLEKQYLTLFTGYTDSKIQTARFELIPDAAREEQKYVVFRISDTDGLVDAAVTEAAPVVLELVSEGVSEVEADPAAKPAKGPFAHFRVPAVCSVRLLDGSDVILQSRVPVYQLGLESSFPL